MQIGKLTFEPILDHIELVPTVVRLGVEKSKALAESIFITEIDPALADTAAFCAKYDVPTGIATNCIIVQAKRAERVWYAACLGLADDMLDVNGKIRHQLDAKRLSFAPEDISLQLTAMEYGGITPLGLPADWPILSDEKVMTNDFVVIGGGSRGSKILISTSALSSLPGVTVMDITK